MTPTASKSEYTARKKLAASGEGVSVWVSLANHRSLGAVYGEAVASKAVSVVAERIERVIGSSRARVLIGPGPGDIEIRTSAHSGSKEFVAVAIRSAVLSPILLDDADIVVAATISDRPQALASTSFGDSDFAVARFRADMAAVVAAYSEIAAEHLHFAEQTVAASDGSGAVLYLERLARIGGNTGQVIVPGAFLPAVERLGLTRAFDAMVVDATIAALKRRPDAVLGCNISSGSLVLDDWWAPALAQLSVQPFLAKRLVIEITETASIADSVIAKGLLDALRSHGCQIAVDDFGAGYSTSTRARELLPDIIKIDRSYLQESREGVTPYNFLQRAVVLAGTLASCVIVEGVESQSDLDRARSAGALWVQGYFIDEQSAPRAAKSFLTKFKSEVRA